MNIGDIRSSLHEPSPLTVGQVRDDIGSEKSEPPVQIYDSFLAGFPCISVARFLQEDSDSVRDPWLVLEYV